MKKLFLLDAYALIYRAYYAFIKNPRYNSKGLNTSAILGFVNTLEDVLRRENPTHIAVVFDPAGKTFRHEAYEQYKAHREATPEDIRKAIPYIKQIIAAYNIPAIEVPGFEADDVIGTLSKLAEKQGFETFMMTPDKDYGQLVSEHIFIYRPKYGDMGYDVLGIEKVKAKFDIGDVSQIIDLLGLMGDKSDNIPGCPGVGEKTAAKLLKDFGSIDNLLKNTDKLKGSLKEKIEANKEQIEFSKFLATIRTDVPVELNEQQLKRKRTNDKKLVGLYNELEFRRLAQKLSFVQNIVPIRPVTTEQPSLFDLFDTAGTEQAVPKNVFERKAAINFKTIKTVAHDYILLDTDETITDFIALLSAQKSFCFDTETTGFEVFTSELVGISFCWEKGKAWYLTLPEEREKAVEILTRFKPVFENG
ncbi:MAG: DNA polymerase I, partial [Prevotellaceae bacterium]|nr:DNA polymerase I [Prevotellaceae bacterium]